MAGEQGGRRRGQGRSRAAGTPIVRRHARFIVNLPVQCSRLSARSVDFLRGRTSDVSGGGIAVELPTRLPPGTRVALEIRTGIGPLRMEADVLWTRRRPDRADIVRHGLCLADRSELLDLPLNVLLGQWLRRRARREVTATPRNPAARNLGSRNA